MRYKSFRIQNFKGIKDTTVDLQGIAGATAPTKSEIRRFFQERLASNKVSMLSEQFKASGIALFDALDTRLKTT